jgi:hypothetical protein
LFIMSAPLGRKKGEPGLCGEVVKIFWAVARDLWSAEQALLKVAGRPLRCGFRRDSWRGRLIEEAEWEASR